MKKLMVFLLLMMSSALALAEPPSDESIRELFTATHLQTMMVTFRSTTEKSMRQGFAAASTSKNLTVEQQRVADGYWNRTEAILDEQLRWDKIEPIYLQVYRESFTQEEVDAMNVFYRTPAGVAVIEKLPAAMARATQLMQPNVQQMLLKMQALQADIMKEMKTTQTQPQPQGPASTQPQTPQ